MVTAPGDLRPGRARALDEAADALEVLGRDQRPDRRRRLSRITDLDLGDQRGDLLAQHRLDRALNEDAGAGEAHLPGVEVLPGDRLRGGVEVGVIEDQEGRLSAELEAHGGEVLGRRPADDARRIRRAREADAVDAGVRNERGAGFFADALDDVQDTRGDFRLERDLGEHRRGERRPFRGLGDHGVPRRERRPDLPGEQHERRVPGGNESGDAGRLEADEVRDLGRVDRLAIQFRRPVGEEADVERGARDHSRAVAGEQRAVVLGLNCGEDVELGEDRVGEPPEDRRTPFGTEARPGREGALRGIDRRIDFGLAAARDFGEQAPVDRRADLEGVVRLYPLAVDPMPGVNPRACDFSAHRAPALLVALQQRSSQQQIFSARAVATKWSVTRAPHDRSRSHARFCSLSSMSRVVHARTYGSSEVMVSRKRPSSSMCSRMASTAAWGCPTR